MSKNTGNLRNIRLLLNDLPEGPIRKNFEMMSTYLSNEAMLKFGFNFITFTTPGPVTNMKIPHSLQFIPLDVIASRDSGNITFNYDQFTDKLLDVTTSGAAVFRGLVGRYRENFE